MLQRRDSAPAWLPDVLPGHDQLTLTLSGVTRGPGETVTPVATLVRRAPGPGDERRPAVLYVHGWNDYYFQAHLGAAFAQLGFAFYALDLRRYGRSLRDGQLGGYVTDLADYDVELDAAREVLRGAGHPAVVLHGHSTGGLVAALHAGDRPGEYAALVLNSPWLDLANQPAVRRFALGIDAAGGWRPAAALPGAGAGEIPSHYARSIHRRWGGEWDYDPAWKSNHERFVIRNGWMRAVIRGQRRVCRGLGLDCPVLCLTSDSSRVPKEFDRAAHTSADTVLDVRTLAGRAVRLGGHVTVVQIPGGMHDLALSPAPARERYVAELARWLAAYGPLPGA